MPKDIESVTNVPKNCSKGFFRSRYIAKKSRGADPDPGFEMSSGPDPVMNMVGTGLQNLVGSDLKMLSHFI